MNDWTPKVGDKIRAQEMYDRDGMAREISYVGSRLAIYITDGYEYCVSLDQLRLEYELVPQFFEEGKVYQRFDNHTAVECLWADETVAVLQNASGAKYLRSQESRVEYEEA